MTHAIELTIKTEQTSVNLTMKSASRVDRFELFQMLSTILGVEPNKVAEFVVKESAQVKSKALVSKPQADPIPKEEMESSQEKSTVSRKLPLVGSAPRIGIVSLGEKFEEAMAKKKEEQPEYWKTGIKVDDGGLKRYKCRYQCSCGKQGNHYIPLKVEEVPCFECDEPLKVELATGAVDALGIPKRDSYGNYYMAKSYEDSEL